MLTLSPFERLDMQPQELSEGELFHINEVGSCDEKGEFIPEKVMLAKNLALKDLSEIFHDIGSANDNMFGS